MSSSFFGENPGHFKYPVQFNISCIQLRLPGIIIPSNFILIEEEMPLAELLEEAIEKIQKKYGIAVRGNTTKHSKEA